VQVDELRQAFIGRDRADDLRGDAKRERRLDFGDRQLDRASPQICRFKRR
jgi:hypothetical protein